MIIKFFSSHVTNFFFSNMSFFSLPFEMKWEIVCIQKHDISLRRICKEVNNIYLEKLRTCYENDITVLLNNMYIYRKLKDNHVRIKDLLVYHTTAHMDVCSTFIVCAACKRRRSLSEGLLTCRYCNKPPMKIWKRVFAGPTCVLLCILFFKFANTHILSATKKVTAAISLRNRVQMIKK